MAGSNIKAAPRCQWSPPEFFRTAFKSTNCRAVPELFPTRIDRLRFPPYDPPKEFGGPTAIAGRASGVDRFPETQPGIRDGRASSRTLCRGPGINLRTGAG
jgi:hypothetical protein